MAKQQKARFGNKAKERRSAKNARTGKYERQKIRTEANKAKKREKHLSKQKANLNGLAIQGD